MCCHVHSRWNLIERFRTYNVLLGHLTNILGHAISYGKDRAALYVRYVSSTKLSGSNDRFRQWSLRETGGSRRLAFHRLQLDLIYRARRALAVAGHRCVI